jgi:hypothetical protein
MTAVFICVVGARFLLPLLIPRFPLPAIIACLVLDGVDQTIFQSFGYDPPGYQGYDKAMDVYYLAVAYLATLRNWTSAPAFVVGRFLYFYRLVGVVAFELSHARPLLLVFPNTFEYFFIAYEAIRTRWSPLRLLLAGWVLAAALIWVVVKLPQEYWIHIAKLDLTDLLAQHPWAGPLVGTALVVVLAVAWWIGRPRTPHPDWSWRWSADPLPEQIDEAHEVAAWHGEHGRVWSWPTLEKVALVSLLSVVFAQTLPGVRSTDLELAVGTGILVVANASISLAASRRSVSFESLAVAFGVRMLVNVGLVVLAAWLLGGASVNEGATVFFLFLLSLLTTMHDRWLPIREFRAAAGPSTAPGHMPPSGTDA